MSLRLEHVTYTYSPGSVYETHALKDVSLEIPSGQFLGVIGHTGSGKSTLIQHFNGLMRPTVGTVYYKGEDIWQEGYSLKRLRSQVGLVFQYPEHQLFEADVLSDVCFGPKNQGCSKEEAEERAVRALQQTGLKEKYYKSSPFELSGGQKRRVAIAGVLAMEPEVLILDEPTAGLDPKGRDEILDQIAWLHTERNITVILVSHSMEDIARYVDRILVMNKGEKAFDGKPEAVFSHYRELEEIGLAAPQITYIMQALHRFDPRVKFIGTFLFLISLFVADSFWGYALATVFLAAAIGLSKVPVKFMLKGLKPLFIILLITVLFNLFLMPGEVLWSAGFLKITREGVVQAVKIGIRLIYLVIGSSIMTLTTTPNQLTDGMEKILAPLNKIKVPVHEISMMMSIALRFIPILMEETDKIMKAQIARGADFESGNIIQRAKSMVPLLVPLFISAFRRADDLAMAMEARCYHGGDNRTQMKPLVYHRRDYAAYVISVLYLGADIALRVFL